MATPQLSTANIMKFQLASLYVLSFNVNIVASLKQAHKPPIWLPADTSKEHFPQSLSLASKMLTLETSQPPGQAWSRMSMQIEII